MTEPATPRWGSRAWRYEVAQAIDNLADCYKPGPCRHFIHFLASAFRRG